MTLGQIKSDMNIALKNGDKIRRAVLADMAASIEKAATAGKTRVEITEKLIDEVLIKYKKTVQEMIDTCPTTEKYADRLAEYKAKMEIVKEYAPKIIDDPNEIQRLIRNFCVSHAMILSSTNKGTITKAIMPFLKSSGCDMKVAKSALDQAIVNGDIVIEAMINGTGDN